MSQEQLDSENSIDKLDLTSKVILFCIFSYYEKKKGFICLREVKDILDRIIKSNIVYNHLQKLKDEKIIDENTMKNKYFKGHWYPTYEISNQYMDAVKRHFSERRYAYTELDLLIR